MFNLDDDLEGQKQVSQDSGDKPIPEGTTGPLEKWAGSGKTPRQVVDEYQKLIWMVDASWSMDERMVGVSTVKGYGWAGDLLELVSQRIANAKVRIASKQAEQGSAFGFLFSDDSFGDEEEDLDSDFSDSYGDDGEPEDEDGVEVPHELPQEAPKSDLLWANLKLDTYTEKDDDGLKFKDEDNFKAYLLGHDVAEEVGAYPIGDQTEVTKLRVVKDHIQQEIKDKYSRYANPDLHVVRFHDSVEYRKYFSEENLSDYVERMQCGGCTNIVGAIRKGLEICKRSPSECSSHHFILTTDGGHNSGEPESAFLTMLPELKRRNIRVDFIHICSSYDLLGTGSKYLKKLCIETGGEYVLVSKVQDYKKKMLEAVQRLALPPAS
jgi:hypothetical protein